VKTGTPALLATILLLSGSRTVMAQQIALSTSGSPAPLVISSATAGSDLVAVTSNAAIYHITVKNAAGIKKITAQLDLPMPAGTSLTAMLSAPLGAVSLGPVTLDTTPRDVVTNIARVANVAGTITYSFAASVTAGVLLASRTVTYTVATFP
jgi:hypothetical protein